MKLIKSLLISCNEFYQELLGYSCKKTQLFVIPSKKWKKFVKKAGLDTYSTGAYFPRNQMAIISDNNPLSLFHEYFGHGLYCEQNLIGRKLVELEKKLMEEEKIFFRNTKNLNSQNLQKFRRQNRTFRELIKFKRQNQGKYELFAIWTEYLLSRENNMLNSFEKKYENLTKKEKEIVENIINFSKIFGDLATFYAQGMAKQINVERVKKLLEEIYKDKLKNAKFILLYGSKKEFSDIDIFMVGENIPELHSSWLDVRVYNPKNFEKRVKLFDIAITNPIMTGEFLFGDLDYFEATKKQILSQPITKKVIEYNIREGENQKKLSMKYPEGSAERVRGLIYSQTYLANALALKEGKRLFDKTDLLLYLSRHK
jgi:hypothetical protein